MSIFSRISKSRQQAREHNAKLAEQQAKEDQQKTPYKHVPTHAASDAMTSAPPSFREADRSRIREANRRRSAMVASGGHHHHMSMNMSMSMNMMSMPGVPRVGSSLSHVSFPTDENANPMVRLPRSYSYNGVIYPPSSHQASQSSREVIYSMPEPGVAAPMMRYPAPYKGKEVQRPLSEMPRLSPTYIKHLGESGSSSGSNSSQDDLEIMPTPLRPQPCPSTAMTEAAAHRMRPGRRISDSSIDRIAMANNARALRDARPPPTSMKPIGSSSHRGSLPAVYASSAVMPRHHDHHHHRPGRNASGTSSPATTASSSSPTPEEEEMSGNDENENENENDEEDNFEDAPEFSQDEEQTPAEPAPPRVAPVDTEQRRDRQRTQSAGLPKLVTVSSPAEIRNRSPPATAFQNASPAPAPAVGLPPKPTPIRREQIILNVFPEAESIPEQASNQKTKRFSRSGTKIKKHRWSTSRSHALAV